MCCWFGLNRQIVIHAFFIMMKYLLNYFCFSIWLPSQFCISNLIVCKNWQLSKWPRGHVYTFAHVCVCVTIFSFSFFFSFLPSQCVSQYVISRLNLLQSMTTTRRSQKANCEWWLQTANNNWPFQASFWPSLHYANRMYFFFVLLLLL